MSMFAFFNTRLYPQTKCEDHAYRTEQKRDNEKKWVQMRKNEKQKVVSEKDTATKPRESTSPNNEQKPRESTSQKIEQKPRKSTSPKNEQKPRESTSPKIEQQPAHPTPIGPTRRHTHTLSGLQLFTDLVTGHAAWASTDSLSKTCSVSTPAYLQGTFFFRLGWDIRRGVSAHPCILSERI